MAHNATALIYLPRLFSSISDTLKKPSKTHEEARGRVFRGLAVCFLVMGYFSGFYVIEQAPQGQKKHRLRSSRVGSGAVGFESHGLAVANIADP